MMMSGYSLRVDLDEGRARATTSMATLTSCSAQQELVSKQFLLTAPVVMVKCYYTYLLWGRDVAETELEHGLAFAPRAELPSQ